MKAKKDETVAKLQDAKVEATRRVHEGTEKVKATIADKTPVVQQKVDEVKGKAVYAEKAPPAVQQRSTRPSPRARPSTPKGAGRAAHVNKAVADARPVVQEKVAQAQGLLADKAPPVERTLREKPRLVAGSRWRWSHCSSRSAGRRRRLTEGQRWNAATPSTAHAKTTCWPPS